MKTAVLYLRVSTTSQVKTDYDPEGISIPAQRVACERKAAQMGIEVIGEYIEPGRSATTVENRPAFQAMLQRLSVERDVDYVIVYNLSRLNRNRLDDAKVLALLRSLKVTLISAQENIDETPAGQLMHGILAAMNEYRSSADGADIRYKMSQKVKNGGTVTRAPIGYLNVRENIDGREIRTIAKDPDRAELIHLAFELVATSNYTLRRLSTTLTDRGLTMRGRGTNAGGTPITAKYLSRVLRDRYYLGEVSYQGQWFSGRHEPIVEPALFDKAQDALDQLGTKLGERQRQHSHYLKTTLWCARCHAKGVESRLLLHKAIGRHGGTYWYFCCTRRQDKLCDGPYLRVADVENEIVRHYRTARMPDAANAAIRQAVTEALRDEEKSVRLLHGHLTKRLVELDKKEDNLLALVEDGTTPVGRARTRLTEIATDRTRVRKELAELGPSLRESSEMLFAALDLLCEIDVLYADAPEPLRRKLNQAIFRKLYIDGEGVEDVEPSAAFSELVSRRRTTGRPPTAAKGTKPPRNSKNAPKGVACRTGASLLELALGGGLSKDAMVELRGLEPLTPTLPAR